MPSGRVEEWRRLSDGDRAAAKHLSDRMAEGLRNRVSEVEQLSVEFLAPSADAHEVDWLLRHPLRRIALGVDPREYILASCARGRAMVGGVEGTEQPRWWRVRFVRVENPDFGVLTSGVRCVRFRCHEWWW